MGIAGTAAAAAAAEPPPPSKHRLEIHMQHF